VQKLVIVRLGVLPKQGVHLRYPNPDNKNLDNNLLYLVSGRIYV